MERRETTHTASVLVIGSGAAGLRAAIAADEAGQQVLIVGKRTQRDAHTVLAAGGINAVLGSEDPEDSKAQHEADTLEEGYWLSNPQIVRALADGAPGAIEDLQDWGVRFAQHPDGRIKQRYFGAHRYRRTCFSGDYTGREMQLALAGEAQRRGIQFLGPTYVTRLLVSDEGVFGAYGFDLETGERRVMLSDVTVLAAGGHTRAWRMSSSRRDENTGDAFYLAQQAGCSLADMELVQFHPTGMVFPEPAAGTLVTEAVRGEGGVLRNKDGERYMERYDPERLELSSRDRVALANYTEIKEGRGGENGGVFLDITHIGLEEILDKLPRMYRQWIDLAMHDISQSPMEVAPTAHYSMGGVVVDASTHETDVRSLFAVGECAAGLHGANRLGGNSLAECVVFGASVGAAAAERSREMSSARDRQAVEEARAEVDGVLEQKGTLFPRPLQRSVRDTMWARCGVVRDEGEMKKGLAEIEEIEEQLQETEARPDLAGYDDLAHWFDLRSLAYSSKATLLSALERKESRGAHQRQDFPETDEAEQTTVVISSDWQISRKPLPEAREEVRALATLSEVGAEQLLE